MPGQSEGCYEKLSKCNISHKIVHLGHAFDLVNKFDKFYFQKNVHNIFLSSKDILGNHNVPGQQNTHITRVDFSEADFIVNLDGNVLEAVNL